MVTTRPPKTIVKPTALGLVANTDTKLLIYGLFQKGRVLAQDGMKGPGDRCRGSQKHDTRVPYSFIDGVRHRNSSATPRSGTLLETKTPNAPSLIRTF